MFRPLVLLLSFLVTSACGGGATPEGPAGDRALLREPIEALLAHTQEGERGGFVIFGVSELEYVRFALDPNGLLLNWPTVQPGGAGRLPVFKQVLERKGWRDVGPDDPANVTAEGIAALEKGELMVASDGLFAQCGRDVERTVLVAATLLQRAFGVTDLGTVDVELATDG